jgi:hypothetical protein
VVTRRSLLQLSCAVWDPLLGIPCEHSLEAPPEHIRSPVSAPPPFVFHRPPHFCDSQPWDLRNINSNMDGKDVNQSASHIEKDAYRSPDEKTGYAPEHVANAGARRESVAHNIVENPLTRQTKAECVSAAESWAAKHGMQEHATLFGKAALVARDPDRFEMLTDITDEEKNQLIYERDHKWNGPTMLWYSIGLCAIGAATQGWDQTGSNGANLSFPEEFGLVNPDGTTTERNEWIVGLINSIIFLTAGLIGAFIVDPLNKWLGRRGEIFLTAIILTATPIGSACAQSWQGLFAARFIMGIGIGAKNATVPIYSAEMAPHRIRGALVMFWQLWVVIGKLYCLSTHLNQLLITTCRYLPRVLRQCHCQGRSQDRMAPATRLRVHSLLHPRDRHLLLPRVSSLAHEARSGREGIPFNGQTSTAPHYRRPRLLLLVCHLRDRARCGWWCRLLCPPPRLLHRSPH